MGLVFGRVAVDTQVRLCFGIGNSERTFIRRNFLRTEQYILRGQTVTGQNAKPIS
jgi:hypothetical protein